MARLLGLGMSSARVSEYERGIRESSLMVLLAYAKSAGISTDNLIDDSVELTFPENLTTPKEVIEWRKGRNRTMVIPRHQRQNAWLRTVNICLYGLCGFLFGEKYFGRMTLRVA